MISHIDLMETQGIDTATRRHTSRSIGAVLAGLVAIFTLTTVTDVVLHAAGVYPAPGEPTSHAAFALATLYRIAYGILGCYVSAWLAPRRPLAHALVLGGIGTLLATIGAFVMWDAGPAWYSIAIILIALPCAWMGGRLAARAR